MLEVYGVVFQKIVCLMVFLSILSGIVWILGMLFLSGGYRYFAHLFISFGVGYQFKF